MLHQKSKGIGRLFLISMVFFCGCERWGSSVQSLPEALPATMKFVVVLSDPILQRRVVLGEESLATTRFSPCSTFKIISTLMGLECGIVQGLETRLGYDGTHYTYAAWNRDVTLQEAFGCSCVPYYKKLVGQLERTYVQETLVRLRYGNCDLSAWTAQGPQGFWLESSLQLSPVEQTEVLERLFVGDGGFSEAHLALLKQCMASDWQAGLRLYGKTGTGRNPTTGLVEAWFVGFTEDTHGQLLFFAAYGSDAQREVTSLEIKERLQKVLIKGDQLHL